MTLAPSSPVMMKFARLKFQKSNAVMIPVASETLRQFNNLCETQSQRMAIFRNLLENVQKSVESSRDVKNEEEEAPKRQFNEIESFATKRRKVEPLSYDNIQIHFPHRCHQTADSRNAKPDVLPVTNTALSDELQSVDDMKALKAHHNLHQSCFHARVPSFKQESSESALTTSCEQNDFDFFLQFNNFNSLFGEEHEKIGSQTHFDNSAMQPQSPNAPSSYSCKWENCCKKVDDNTLLDHLIGDHINEEYSLDNRERSQNHAFQCEWYNCGFTNEDYESFVSHLSTHRELNEDITKPIYAAPLLSSLSVEDLPNSTYDKARLYSIRKTSNGYWPVYKRLQNTKVSTEVKRVDGNVHLFAKELVQHLDTTNPIQEKLKINSVTGLVSIKGDHTEKIVSFLEENYRL
ncbi:hypothetical protein CA3LBN_003531 [Candidozyma haemuli]|uniref:Large ribosomal subunit protein mL49 n=1 Tax=Candidozyma haemuli TaxID=45357 RepID=A0ABX8IBE6_9ASCO|nr:hypothetical protein CA3LBN_003531 [[Candida] haemuloni]